MKTAHADIHNSRAVRTLIADDSPFMLKTLAQILSIEGNFALVGTATDGCQAVRQALTMEPELVLMDYRMPHLNGLEATRLIKQSENPPLIIIVTSDDTPSGEALAKAAGADGFVKKGGNLRDQLRSIFQKLFQFGMGTFAGREKPKSSRLRGRGWRVKMKSFKQQIGDLQGDDTGQQKCFVCSKEIMAGGWFCRIPREAKRIVLCCPCCALRYFEIYYSKMNGDDRDFRTYEHNVQFLVDGEKPCL